MTCYVKTRNRGKRYGSTSGMHLRIHRTLVWAEAVYCIVIKNDAMLDESQGVEPFDGNVEDFFSLSRIE